MTTVAVLAEPGVVDGWGAATSLAAALAVDAHNVGDLARAAVQQSSAWGRRFEEHLRAGNPVPGHEIVEFVTHTLAASRGGWVLFNFPRTVGEAELLAEQGHSPGTVVEIRLDERNLESDWRLAERQQHYRLALAEHRTKMAPVQAFYRRTGAYHVLPQPPSFERLAADLHATVRQSS